MTRRRRLVVGLLAVLVALPLLSGCGRRETDSDTLRALIEHTRRQSASFEYTDARNDTTITVQGIVEDDFRFKSRVFYDEQPGFDEVVRDDVLVMRVLDPNRLPDLIDVEAATTVDQSTELKGISVVQALKSKRWVQDDAGAPVISGIGQTEKTLGKDPALDAVTVLDYVLGAMLQSDGARRFDPDTLSPTYPGDEDPFEDPKEGETRYDLVKPGLPSPGSARSGTGGQVAIPGTKHFRKMAVYVKDGVITRVEERIEVTGRSLGKFADWMELFLRESDDQKGRQELRAVLDTTPQSELGPKLIELLSSNLQAFGQEPILQRSMSLRMTDFGSKIEVTLPEEQKIRGKLTAMVTSGASKKPKPSAGGGTGAAGSTADSSTTTTSTVTSAVTSTTAAPGA